MSTITKFNLSVKTEQQLALNTFNHLLNNERLIELKEIKPTRSNLQNSSLHLFCNIISDELNNLGLEFSYTGLTGIELNTRYTMQVVKDFVWKPIQKVLFDTDSTTKLTTQQINEISDVLIKHFGEKGIYIAFPNIADKLHKEDLENK